MTVKTVKEVQNTDGAIYRALKADHLIIEDWEDWQRVKQAMKHFAFGNRFCESMLDSMQQMERSGVRFPRVL